MRCFCAMLMSFIPQGPSGRTGYEMVTGQTPDISEFLDFDFYDLVWYHVDQHASTGQQNRKLARWVGIAHKIGSALCYWLIPVSGKPVAKTTVQHVTSEDLRNPEIKAQVDEFNKKLGERLNDENFRISDDFYVEDFYDEFDADGNNLTNYGRSGLDFYLNEDDPAYGDKENTPPDEEYEMSREKPEADDIDDMDKYIGAKIVLDQNNPGNLATAVVKRRVTDFSGRPVGRAHINPMLDTREYEVELEDGTTDRYFANTIAENLWSQCDSEGRDFLTLKEIVDHKKNNRALSKDDGFDVKRNGQKVPKKTTVGWQLLAEWKDGSTQWLDLKDLKDSNPIEVAEYAVANKTSKEPAFA